MTISNFKYDGKLYSSSTDAIMEGDLVFVPRLDGIKLAKVVETADRKPLGLLKLIDLKLEIVFYLDRSLLKKAVEQLPQFLIVAGKEEGYGYKESKMVKFCSSESNYASRLNDELYELRKQGYRIFNIHKFTERVDDIATIINNESREMEGKSIALQLNDLALSFYKKHGIGPTEAVMQGEVYEQFQRENLSYQNFQFNEYQDVRKAEITAYHTNFGRVTLRPAEGVDGILLKNSNKYILKDGDMGVRMK